MAPSTDNSKGYEGTLIILSLGKLFSQEIFVFKFDDSLALKLYTTIGDCPQPRRGFLRQPLGLAIPSIPTSDLEPGLAAVARAGYSLHMGVRPPPSPLEDEDPEIQSFLHALSTQAMSLAPIGHQTKRFKESTWLDKDFGFDLNSLDWLTATAESHQISSATEAPRGPAPPAIRI